MHNSSLNTILIELALNDMLPHSLSEFNRSSRAPRQLSLFDAPHHGSAMPLATPFTHPLDTPLDASTNRLRSTSRQTSCQSR